MNPISAAIAYLLFLVFLGTVGWILVGARREKRKPKDS